MFGGGGAGRGGGGGLDGGPRCHMLNLRVKGSGKPSFDVGHYLINMTVYRGCGFAVFRSCGSHSERNLVAWFSIEVYGSKTLFSLLFSKYWS